MKTFILFVGIIILGGCCHKGAQVSGNVKIETVKTVSAPKPRVIRTVSETTRVVHQVPVFKEVVTDGPTITKTIDESGRTINEAPLHSAIPASPLAKTPAVNFRSDLDTTGK